MMSLISLKLPRKTCGCHGWKTIARLNDQRHANLNYETDNKTTCGAILLC